MMARSKYDWSIFKGPEGVDIEKHVIVTYYGEVPRDADLFKWVESLALEQSTGSWDNLPAETPQVRERSAAKIVGIYEAPTWELEIPMEVKTREIVFQIAFPIVNMGYDIAALLITTCGNISAVGRVKILDMHFPKSYLARYKGPKFGIPGIRELLGVYDRPLTLNIIKPNLGFTPDVGAELCYEVAVGGADIIKDDELLIDPDYCPMTERVKKYMAAVKAAYEETGEKTLYVVNVAGRPDQMWDNVRRALDAGANAIMMDYWCVGLGMAQSIAESEEVQVPILGHPSLSGALYASHYSGLTSALAVAKLPRLVGMDMLITGGHFGKFPCTLEGQGMRVFACRAPMHNIRPIWPEPGGGTHPGTVWAEIEECGKDSIIGAGSGIHSHPMGARAGARAIRLAIDAVMEGRTPEEAATEHKEIAVAFQKWGVAGRPDFGEYVLKKGKSKGTD
jgi:2,3-diketo-5-methylthiopentyl-1-phosphate enolase